MIRIDALPYPVLIAAGLLREAPLPKGRLFLVTDENVLAAGWPDRLRAEWAGRVVLPPGEGAKSLPHLEEVLDAMLQAGLQRDDHVVAVGGGVVSDVAGFAAAVLKRGCKWIAAPTTLLAQADAAIGGKTGINARQGKNLIGAFHPPALVLIDPNTLATLPPAELRSGYAEVVKYGLVGDPEFFAWCETNAAALLAGADAARLHAIETCVRAKAAYVAGDEHDRTGRRALLNFGHSFGHAIEAETGMPHGEAVAIGMATAFRLSVERGICRPEDADRVTAHLKAVGLPMSADVPADRLAARMAHDKKGGALILTRGIGKAFVAGWSGATPPAPPPLRGDSSESGRALPASPPSRAAP